MFEKNCVLVPYFEWELYCNQLQVCEMLLKNMFKRETRYDDNFHLIATNECHTHYSAWLILPKEDIITVIHNFCNFPDIGLTGINLYFHLPLQGESQ